MLNTYKFGPVPFSAYRLLTALERIKFNEKKLIHILKVEFVTGMSVDKNPNAL